MRKRIQSAVDRGYASEKDWEEDEERQGEDGKSSRKTYVEEQADLKRAFIDAAAGSTGGDDEKNEGDDDGDGFLSVRARSDAERPAMRQKRRSCETSSSKSSPRAKGGS